MYDKALVHFAEVERLAPLDSAPHAATGLIRLHQGLVAEAITSLHKVIPCRTSLNYLTNQNRHLP